MVFWYDPFDEMEKRMRKMMRRMWDFYSEPWREFKETMKFDTFPIDISETNDELIVTADLPGFDKDEIKVHVTDNTIEIVGKRKEEKKQITKTMFRQERSIGAVRRYFTLPVEVDPETVEAELKNGVLTIKMKKKKVKKGKEVQVK